MTDYEDSKLHLYILNNFTNQFIISLNNFLMVCLFN